MVVEGIFFYTSDQLYNAYLVTVQLPDVQCLKSVKVQLQVDQCLLNYSTIIG